MKERLLDEKLIWKTHASSEHSSAVEEEEMQIFFKILRFLRARHFNINASFDLLKNDILWHREENREQLHLMNGGEVLGVDPLLLYPYYPTYVQGHDKEGRPVSYRHFGYFETWNITKVVNMKTMVAFHTWEAERLLSLTRENSKKFNCHIETFTCTFIQPCYLPNFFLIALLSSQ